MKNTYHVDVELNAPAPDGELQYFNAVVVAEHNHDFEATEEVKTFFESHGIRCMIAHTWEVA